MKWAEAITENEYPLVCLLHRGTSDLRGHANQLEIILFLEGKGNLLVNEANYEVEAGDIRIINADNIHGIIEADDLAYLSLRFDLLFFNRLIPGILYTYFDCVPDPAVGGQKNQYVEDLKAKVLAILRAIEIAEDHYNDFMMEKAMDILLTLKRWFTLSGFSSGDNTERERIWEIVDYIFKNYDRRLPLQEVADKVGLSPNYLSHYVKSASGRSFQDLVNYTRCEKSLGYLLDEKLSINEISDECGFSEAKYFKKHFFKNYGMTPKEYRLQYSKKQSFDFKEEDDMDLLLFGEEDLFPIAERWMRRYGSWSIPAEHEDRFQIEVDLNNESVDPPDFWPGALLLNRPEEGLGPVGMRALRDTIENLHPKEIIVTHERHPLKVIQKALEDVVGKGNCPIRYTAASLQKGECYLFEQAVPAVPFLFSETGIPSPLYYCLLLGRQMTGRCLYHDEYLTLYEDKGHIQILLDRYDRKETDGAYVEFGIRIYGLKHGNYLVCEYSLNANVDMQENCNRVFEMSSETLKPLIENAFSPTIECWETHVDKSFFEIQLKLSSEHVSYYDIKLI